MAPLRSVRGRAWRPSRGLPLLVAVTRTGTSPAALTVTRAGMASGKLFMAAQANTDSPPAVTVMFGLPQVL